MLESAKLISIFFPSFMVNFIAASSQEVDRLVADMVGVRDVKQNIISLIRSCFAGKKEREQTFIVPGTMLTILRTSFVLKGIGTKSFHNPCGNSL
jgi:hypothetical protein